jgi:hypothetical protein
VRVNSQENGYLPEHPPYSTGLTVQAKLVAVSLAALWLVYHRPTRKLEVTVPVGDIREVLEEHHIQSFCALVYEHGHSSRTPIFDRHMTPQIGHGSTCRGMTMLLSVYIILHLHFLGSFPICASHFQASSLALTLAFCPQRLRSLTRVLARYISLST